MESRAQHRALDPRLWTIVLAAGDGRRLKTLTTTGTGASIPKQFCSLNRRECLLELALRRAAAVSAPEKTCAVVAKQHKCWWNEPLAQLAADNIFVQPMNRGTAVGIASALLQLESRDPDATAILLPTDHFVADEAILAESLDALGWHALNDPSGLYLLGSEPEWVDTELGYIVPCGPGVGPYGVKALVEKPWKAEARALVVSGALWSMFIVAGSVRVLLGLLERSYNFVSPLRFVQNQPIPVLNRFYQELPVIDFSRDVLAHFPQHLRVLVVPSCGWRDLGTPGQVAFCARRSAQPRLQAEPARYWNLAEKLALRSEIA